MPEPYASESTVRLTIFGTVLLSLLLAERLWPRRGEHVGAARLATNGALVIIDTLALRLLLPILAVGAAAWAHERDLGLLRQLGVPPVLGGIAAFVLLDLLIYAQHRLMHAIPWLWRLHRVHHSDVAFDVTTALRFHPIEILLSMLIKVAAVIVLGAPVMAVIAFEVALNATAMFNHSDIALPPALDRWIRRVIVTPDMHRVHHSVHRVETDSNFGFNFAWWDRLLGTYTPQPIDGHDRMRIGLTAFRAPPDQRLDALLWQPFAPETEEFRRSRSDSILCCSGQNHHDRN